MWWSKRKREIIVQVDSALSGRRAFTGLGVVVRDVEGRILDWVMERTQVLDNTSAEYAALILGLQVARRWQADIVHVYSDSEVVVYQMDGRFAVRSQRLRQWHEKACALARQFRRVTYTHISREYNRLADALANEALMDGNPWSRKAYR